MLRKLNGGIGLIQADKWNKIDIDGTIKNCVEDFEKFIKFNESEKPVLSAKLGVFGKKDSFKLNSIIYSKKDVIGPNYNQDQYQSIDLMFELALLGKLFYKGNDEKGNPSFIKTPRLESYLSLSEPEKYVFLLEIYWTKYDFDKKFERWMPITAYYNFLVSIANSEPENKIIKDVNHGTERMFSECALFMHHLRFFGLGKLELIEGAKGKYEDTISAFKPNVFGINASNFLLSEVVVLWNRKDLYFILDNKEKNNTKKKSSNPFSIFKNLFPGNIVQNTVENTNEEDRNGVYTFRISLSKNLWRKINISGKHTLDNLHDAIQDAFDFDNDHLYAFYIGGNRKTGEPIYCRDTGRRHSY